MYVLVIIVVKLLFYFIKKKFGINLCESFSRLVFFKLNFSFNYYRVIMNYFSTE